MNYPPKQFDGGVQFQQPGAPQGPSPNAPPPPVQPGQFPDIPPPTYTQSMQDPYTGTGNAYPQTGYPQTGYPPAGYPQAGYPQTGYPQSGYPQSGFPQPGFLQPGMIPAGFAPRPGFGNQGTALGGSNLPQFQSNASDVSETVDQNESLTNWRGFTDKAIRRAFIRKVYAILMLQLSFTVGVIALFIFQKDVNYFVKHNIGVYVAAYVAFLIIYFVLLCCGNLRRTYPTNYILLFLFTGVLSYLVGAISSFHSIDHVMIAMGICASCCLAITLFSFQTKYDFTQCGGILFILSWVLFMFGIIAALTFRTVPILHTVYASLGALLFMAFLAYDTQMLMGGKKYQLSAEEHVFAALQLYMDVVQIFLFILSLVGGGKKS